MEELIVSDVAGVGSGALASILRNAYGSASSSTLVDALPVPSSSAFSITEGVSGAMSEDPKIADQAMRESLSAFFEDSIRCPASLSDLLRHTQAGGSGKLPSVFTKLPPVAVSGVFDVRRERPTSELQLFPGVSASANAASWLGSDESSGSASRYDARSKHGDGIHVVPSYGVRAAMDAGSGSHSSPSRTAAFIDGGAVAHLVVNLSCSRSESLIASVATMLVSHLVVVGSAEECYHALHRITQSVIAGKAASAVVKPILSASGSSNASELTIVVTSDHQQGGGASGASKRSTVEASLKTLGHGIASTVRIVDVKEDSAQLRGGGYHHRTQSLSSREVASVQQEIGRAILRTRPNNLRHDRPPLSAYHWFHLLNVVLARSLSPASGGGGLVASTLEGLGASAVAWGTACYKAVLDTLSPHSSTSSPNTPTADDGRQRHHLHRPRVDASAEEIHAVAKWLAVDLFRELIDPFILPGHPLEQLQSNIHMKHAEFRTVMKEGVYQYAQPIIRSCMAPLAGPLKMLCEGDPASSIASVSEWLAMVDQALAKFMSDAIHDSGTSERIDGQQQRHAAAGRQHAPASRWSEQAKRSAVYDMLVEWILPNTRVVGEILAEKDGLLLHHKDSIIRQSNAAIAELETTLAEASTEKKRLLAHEHDVKGKLDAAMKQITDAQSAAMQLLSTMSKELSELQRKAVEAAFLAENGLGDSVNEEGEQDDAASSSSSSDSSLSSLGVDQSRRHQKRVKNEKKGQNGAASQHMMKSIASSIEQCRSLLNVLGMQQSLIQAQDHTALLQLQWNQQPTQQHSPRQPDSTATRMRGFSRGGGGVAASGRPKRSDHFSDGAAGTVLNQSAVTSHPSANVSSDQTHAIRELRVKEQRRREEEHMQRKRASGAHARSSGSSLNSSLVVEHGGGVAGPDHQLFPVLLKGNSNHQVGVDGTLAVDYSSQLVELRDVHASTLRKLSELQREISTRHSAERRLQEQIVALESHLRDCAMDNNTLSERNRELAEKVESLTHACEQQGTMLDTESKKLAAAQGITQELRDAITQHEVTIFTLSQYKSETTSTMAFLNGRVSELETVVTEQRSELTGMAKSKASAESLLELTRVELDVDRSALNQCRSDAKELEMSLLNERAAMRDSCAKYERHIQELLEKFDSSTERQRQQIAHLEKSNFDLVQQLRAKEEAHTADRSALQDAKSQLVAELHKTKSELAEISRRCSAAEKSLREAVAANKVHTTAAEHDQTDLTILRKELAFAREEFSKSQAELRHSEELRKRLQHSVEAFDTLISEQRQLSRSDQEALEQNSIIGSRPLPPPSVLTSRGAVNTSTATEELQRLTEQMRTESSRHRQLEYRRDGGRRVDRNQRAAAGDAENESDDDRGDELNDKSLVDDMPVGLNELTSDDLRPADESEVAEGEKRRAITTTRTSTVRNHHNPTRHISAAATSANRDDSSELDNSGYRTPLVVLDSASLHRQALHGLHGTTSLLVPRRVPVPLPPVDLVRSTSNGVRPIEPHLHVIAQVEALMRREGR